MRVRQKVIRVFLTFKREGEGEREKEREREREREREKGKTVSQLDSWISQKRRKSEK